MNNKIFSILNYIYDLRK